MILGLLYVSFAVEDVDATRRAFDDLLGMWGEHMPGDDFLGTDKGARLPFPNGCWLYAMESKNPQSPVFQALQEKGPGLERVAFLTDDIETDFERARRGGVPLDEDDLVNTPLATRFVVPSPYVTGVTVELVQPKSDWWAVNSPPSIEGVLGLQHIGVAAKDLEGASDSFERLFGLPVTDLRTDQHGGEQKDIMVLPGNDRLWLHVTESWGENARVYNFLRSSGQGLEHLCIEVEDIRHAVKRVTDTGTPIFENKIFTNRPDGFEAFIYPEHTTGVTIELIEPYPTSRGYRPRKARCVKCWLG